MKLSKCVLTPSKSFLTRFLLIFPVPEPSKHPFQPVLGPGSAFFSLFDRMQPSGEACPTGFISSVVLLLHKVELP